MKDRIKQLRLHHGLSQQAFSDAIGITRQYLSLLENGEREPSDLVINAISREFGVNPQWIRTGEGERLKHAPSDQLIPQLQQILARYPAVARAMGQAVTVMTEADFQRLNEIIDLCTQKEQP